MIHISNKSIYFSAALKGDSDFPSVRTISVLHQPHALPSSHPQMTVCDGNSERDSAYHTLYVSRHIVRPFIVVLIEFFPLGSNPVQSFFHVLSDSGVGVLVYAKTGGGVKQEDVAKSHFELF
jgi:hypothetical protein